MKNVRFSKSAGFAVSIGIFVLVAAELVFAAFPLQTASPVWGLCATELLMLATAVVGCFALGQRPSEVFPMKKPKLRQIFGVLVLYIAMYIMSLAAISLVSIIAPEQVLETNSGLSDIFAGITPAARLIIVAVMPAVCEEAIHRGLIMHFLKPLGKYWAIMLIVGVQFGIFHFDGVRFLNTAIAGAMIAYIMLKTDNLLLCMLIHFINNFPSVFISSSESSGTAEAVTELGTDFMRLSYAISAGFFIFLCAAVPWLIYAGSKLLGTSADDSAKKRKLKICTVVSAVCAVLGSVLVLVTLVLSAGYYQI